ncbi:hypothetical protein CEV32_0559 [Brucella rhizosphaerae]|uniref:Uncharacterized protein n=1 Tax=Brucella rhizosphaerae TaxID=571254 RepID=A0A256FI76_9HYPH|nr:hypothetical protein CEV32_0559 [Brucella rhizosphaerae]
MVELNNVSEEASSKSIRQAQAYSWTSANLFEKAWEKAEISKLFGEKSPLFRGRQ